MLASQDVTHAQNECNIDENVEPQPVVEWSVDDVI